MSEKGRNFTTNIAEKWPRTASGLPSTAGTTASICIIKNSKLYIGHVGDSAIVLGYNDSRDEKIIRPKAKLLTKVWTTSYIPLTLSQTSPRLL